MAQQKRKLLMAVLAVLMALSLIACSAPAPTGSVAAASSAPATEAATNGTRRHTPKAGAADTTRQEVAP